MNYRSIACYLLLMSSISFSLYVLYSSVGNIELEKSKYLNFNPYPDAPEYLAMANSWLEGNGYRIKIGDEYLPSRYPPGLSIAYCWVARLTGSCIAKVPYMANYYLGIFIVVSGFGYFLLKRKYIAAFFLPLMLVTQPTFLTYTRAPMSEMLSVFFILIVCFLLLEYFEKENLMYYLLACATIGVSYLIRSQNLFFGFLLVVPIIELRRSSNELKRVMIMFMIGGLVFMGGLTPSFYNSWVNYGSFDGNGYGFWLSDLNFEKLFGICNIEKHLLFIGKNIVHHNDRFTLAHMFGVGVHFSALFVLLSFFAILKGLFSGNVFRIMTYAMIVVFLLTSTFLFVSLRFYVVYIVLLVFVVANFGGILYLNARKNGIFFKISGCIYVLCFILMFLGIYPVLDNGSVRINFTTLEFMKNEGIGRASYVYDITNRIKKETASMEDEDILLVSNHSPVLLDVFLPNNITIVPDSEVNQYMFSNKFRWTDERTVEYVEKYRREHLPVFLLTCVVHRSKNEIVSSLQPYQWEPILQKDYMSLYRFSGDSF